MADFHLSQLTTLNTPSDDDTLVINDNTTGAPVTKSISFKNLKLEVQSQNIGAGLEFDSVGRYTISVGSGLKFDDLTSDADLMLDISNGLRFSGNSLVFDINNDTLRFIANTVGVRTRAGGGIGTVSFNDPNSGLFVEWDRLAYIQDTVPNTQTGPSTPIEKGRMWVNTSPSTPELKVYNGATWKDMGVSLNTLKEVVAASSSFADFQSKVDAMTD